MKLSIEYFDQTSGEHHAVADLVFSPFEIDWSKVKPHELLAAKDNWQNVTLPNKENIDIKCYFEKGNEVVTIDVRQSESVIFSLVASNISCFAFITLSGAHIGVDASNSEI